MNVSETVVIVSEQAVCVWMWWCEGGCSVRVVRGYDGRNNIRISHFTPREAGILFSLTKGVLPIFSNTVLHILGLGFLQQ